MCKETSNQVVLFAESSPILAAKVPGALLRVEAAVADVVGRVMPAEEELARIVRERDTLRGDLEVDDGSAEARLLLEQSRDGLLDGLGPGQRLRVQGEEVEHVAGCNRVCTTISPRPAAGSAILVDATHRRLERAAAADCCWPAATP